MKVAVFYDWVNQWGGAEKVLMDILKCFPKADIYSLVYDEKKAKWIGDRSVSTSFLNKLPGGKQNATVYTPLYPLALEQFNFDDYQIVISTTSTIGHCLRTNPQTLYICYFHNTNRYVYQTPQEYRIIKPLLNLYKKSDFIFGQRPDVVWCNSNTVANRIFKVYSRKAEILHPGVAVDTYKFENKKSDYYLVLSRLVKHKRIDIAIDACRILGKKLIVAGSGRDEKYYMNMGGASFLGRVDEETKKKLLAECKGLLFPQEEDFGLTPIEAMASGSGVIAYGKGGATETVVDGVTGVLFNSQESKSMAEAILKYEKLNIDPLVCQARAWQFDSNHFVLNFKKQVIEEWKKYQRAINL